MDDFLLSFFYPMMLVLTEILVKKIIKLWENQLKKIRSWLSMNAGVSIPFEYVITLEYRLKAALNEIAFS